MRSGRVWWPLRLFALLPSRQVRPGPVCSLPAGALWAGALRAGALRAGAVTASFCTAAATGAASFTVLRVKIFQG